MSCGDMDQNTTPPPPRFPHLCKGHLSSDLLWDRSIRHPALWGPHKGPITAVLPGSLDLSGAARQGQAKAAQTTQIRPAPPRLEVAVRGDAGLVPVFFQPLGT